VIQLWLTGKNTFDTRATGVTRMARIGPALSAPGIAWGDLLALAIWLAVGSAMMVRFLRVQARAE